MIKILFLKENKWQQICKWKSRKRENNLICCAFLQCKMMHHQPRYSKMKRLVCDICVFMIFNQCCVCSLKSSPGNCSCGKSVCMTRKRRCLRWDGVTKRWSPTCCRSMWPNTSLAQRWEMRSLSVFMFGYIINKALWMVQKWRGNACEGACKKYNTDRMSLPFVGALQPVL